MDVIQQWNPHDWESFSLYLLQVRHGVLNVHKVPATHSGDLGIDFYCTTDSVIYQCYAVEEPVDITTRAHRQKIKITTDLKKMVAGKAEIIKLFHSELIKKWILLVPLHDSKDVTLHCTKKTKDLRMQNTGFLDPAFEVCIHDQGLFPEANLKTAMSEFTNISLNVQPPTQLELDQWRVGSPDLVTNATAKLSKRAFPGPIQDAVTNGIELFLKSGALIEALRTSAPDLYEKIAAAISQRARRLSYVGPQGGPVPSNIMNTELETLIRSIQDAAPALSQNNAEEIALGALSDWIMRCPLDFPPYDV